jgi:hypothetical protein
MSQSGGHLLTFRRCDSAAKTEVTQSISFTQFELLNHLYVSPKLHRYYHFIGLLGGLALRDERVETSNALPVNAVLARQLDLLQSMSCNF